MKTVCFWLSALLVLTVGAQAQRKTEKTMLTLTMRSQKPVEGQNGKFEAIHERKTWEVEKTAIVVCDMWDKHWCAGATGRVGEMAPVMNEVLKAARKRGVLIVHAPSDTMEFYKDAPPRKRAQDAPKAPAPPPFQNPRPPEAPLPIDDSDGGCDTAETPWYKAWTRQHPALEIAPEDVISDNGDEVYNVFHQRGIHNVILMGVHTNMCVLGRSFAIRSMAQRGLNVALMRDMTDTMYNPKKSPYVTHCRGTDLVVEHIEKYWCPSITSSAFTGKPAFRFKEDTRPHVVCIASEDEYNAKETLAEFARKELEEKLGYRCTFAQSDSNTDVPGIESLLDADLAIFYLRRRTLPAEQLAQVRKYLEAGKPVLALRTSSHGFQNWLEFDKTVLGGNYQGHHNNKEAGDPATFVKVIADQRDHPILAGFPQEEFRVTSWLYKVLPLAKTATPLLMGRVEGREPREPVAWTNTYRGGRIFYTSLGHPEDFQNEAFRRLLSNAAQWALKRP